MIWFFIFSGLIACTGKPVSASCQIKMSPPRVVVRFGDPLSANCSSSSQIEGIGWESSYGGVGLTSGVSSLTLKIDSVIAWVIDPQCYVNPLGDGDQCIESLPVTVYKTPKSVSMTLLNEMGPMVEGKVYHIQCDVVDVAPVKSLSVCWYKGNDMLFSDDYVESTPTPLDKTSVLNLTAHRSDNGTQIWCEAKLDLGLAEENPPAMQSKSHEVIVLYPPTFTKPANETLELPAGKTISLNCTATGNPVPVYSWNIPNSTRETSKNQSVNGPVLTPSFQFPGNYSCTASNTLGSSTKYFTVIEATGDRTTLAAIVGVFASLGVLLFIGGAIFVTKDGTFSFNKGNYLRGQPTSSAPV